MSAVERVYEYEPKWTVILLSGVFFGLCAVVLGIKAATNERGLILLRIIELGPQGASWFYWILTACGVGFVAIAALLTYHRLTVRQRLVLGATALTVPASRWSRTERDIAYRDIFELSTNAVSGQRFLVLKHAGGKCVIAASLLPSQAAFEEVCALVESKVRAAQDGRLP
jgi:hypothetical protein